MASRAETSRRASLVVSSEMVSWFSMELKKRKHSTFNIQHSTPNIELPEYSRHGSLDVECSSCRNNALLISWFILLFNNFRHHEKPIGFGGRVAERLFVGEGRADFVGSGHIDQRKCVRGRLNAGDVGLLEFFDVAQDVSELGGKFLFLVRRQGNARKMRDVFDINFGGCHAGRLRFQVPSSKIQVRFGVPHLREPSILRPSSHAKAELQTWKPICPRLESSPARWRVRAGRGRHRNRATPGFALTGLE